MHVRVIMIRVLYDNILADDAEVKFQNENVIIILFCIYIIVKQSRLVSVIIL